MEGVKQDTVLNGRMAEAGKTTIVLPAQYANYRGVGRLAIKECKSINLILNGEKLIAINEVRGYDNIEVTFDQSEENRFIDDITARQRQLLEKYQYVLSGLNEFQMKDQMYPALRQEQMGLENQYVALQKEIRNSPLYAGRLLEMLNCLTGTGSSLTQSTEDVRKEQQKYISDRLNFSDLYTSGFWQLMMDLWFDLNQTSDTLLLDNSRHLLDRVTDVPIRRELTQSIIRQFTKYAKDYLLPELGVEYLTMPINGQTAPEIQTGDRSFLPKNALVMFYETGCGLCHNELEALKQKYQLLVDNNVRVITIAADESKDVFEYTAEKLPWSDKFCDFKGFDGINFRNYGIAGTPTFILIDAEGIVRGRYAQLKEWLK
ncbi:hypothetical protein AGMMS50262_21370 [Bacteroidia bacterium]|nr:hypothetical protein AGMMS50262_21370 [Bacteroidia bacterium]